ncbi:MAG: 30S ribosomal protein S6--L-glutamate ligase [Gammaproteobacteria bacterium]|nr:30S ribosomal protein S6--L-glutamate ligase [Gammaproteobacteria bacterium]MCD8542274.1 30S ribosomal protein S6--L-glutamate ligase [Gammaproteobacteria bacterium]
MRLAILSQKETIYSTKRLKEAALALGHDVSVINYQKCYVNICANHATVHYEGKPAATYDAIIPRIGAKRTFYGTAIVRQFETMGVYSINSSLAITRSRDKLRAQQLLVMKGIDMPVTGFAPDAESIHDLIHLVGGTPLIIKLLEGTQGVGVLMAETPKAAESVAQALAGLKANIIIQEFIKESKGEDIRCFVVGNKVIAAMKRTAAVGEFRANVHRGGIAQTITITEKERSIAVKAAKIMGLKMAGVDILRSNRGPLVLEVNSSPGLEGIERATGIDIATRIIRYLEKAAKPIAANSRYQG